MCLQQNVSRSSMRSKVCCYISISSSSLHNTSFLPRSSINLAGRLLAPRTTTAGVHFHSTVAKWYPNDKWVFCLPSPVHLTSCESSDSASGSRLLLPSAIILLQLLAGNLRPLLYKIDHRPTGPVNVSSVSLIPYFRPHFFCSRALLIVVTLLTKQFENNLQYRLPLSSSSHQQLVKYSNTIPNHN